MVSVQDRSTSVQHETHPGSRHGIPLVLPAVALAVIFALITIDVLGDARAHLDGWLIRRIQAIELPGIPGLLRPVDTLTSHDGAIVAWALIFVLFLALRWWLPAMLALTLPAGGLINQAISSFVGRDRPAAGEVERVIGETDAAAYPSGHVIGAVLLYGLLFVVADHIGNRVLRLAVKAMSLTVILSVGLARVWYGAHWPSDVTAAYALGGLLLIGMIAVYRRIDAVTGPLPLIHAATPAHDERIPHAHALTSLVLFEGATVEKVYNPGFLPRALYWLAFQAEFPYIRNQAALRAAVLRRNLAGMLTEYWYGETRVARASGIVPVAGSYAIASEFVDGHAPADRAAARRFLAGLRARFEEAGLPTWQIDPRQPRAVDNVLETANGTYMIVDLESGLVSPLASLRTWARAFNRGLVPIYDDVFFDITRGYVEREEPVMRAVFGEAWVQRLRTTLDAAEAEATVWHQSEPRLWSALVRGVRHGFYVRRWPSMVRAEVTMGQQRAEQWTADAIAAWEADGRVTPVEAAELRGQMESPEFQAVLPHLGAHLAFTLVLRFPLGSIARFTWTTSALTLATVRLLLRRSSRAAWRQARTVHSPLVFALCVLPSVGGFAYLASPPVRRNRLLARVTADAVLQHLPGGIYHRTRLDRLIARPAAPTGTTEGTPAAT